LLAKGVRMRRIILPENASVTNGSPATLPGTRYDTMLRKGALSRHISSGEMTHILQHYLEFQRPYFSMLAGNTVYDGSRLVVRKQLNCTGYGVTGKLESLPPIEEKTHFSQLSVHC
jgi:hypothetical protein